MNYRLDRETDNIVPQMVAELRTDLDALKAGNQTVGPDGVVMNRIVSGNSLDISDSLAATATQSWRVVFTPTRMKDAYADFSYSWSVSGGTGFEQAYFWPDTANTSATSRSWIFTIAADTNNVAVSALFALKSPDTGSIAVVKL